LRRGDAAARDAAFDDRLQQIGVVPEPAIEAVAGAPAINGGTLTVMVDYETDARLS
jgi:hypothetical protein